MQLRIVFTQFWRDLKAQRLRTALTLFGLAWGTFCVVLLLSFGEGLSRKQIAAGAAMGERIILIWGSSTSLPYEGFARGRIIQFEDSDADAIIREVPEVERASPEYGITANLTGPNGKTTIYVSGVRPCFEQMRGIELGVGSRFINEPDEAGRRRVCVLGSQVKQDLFGDEEAIGRTLEIAGIPFLVVGTMPHKEQDSNYNGQDDNKAFIPSSAAGAALGLRRPDNLVVEVVDHADGQDVIRQITAVMAKIHHYDPEDQEALITWDVGEMLAMFRMIFIGFRVFLGVLGVLTLAVAGIGVANIMSMVVEDRTSQIGIAMALGARKRWVLGQILMETMLVVAVGGGLGVLFASGVVHAAGFLPLEGSMGTPVFSWQIAVLTAALLGLIGLVSGMGPARRAANLNPALALRS